jgi:site-specific DNA-cytosine methylase
MSHALFKTSRRLLNNRVLLRTMAALAFVATAASVSAAPPHARGAYHERGPAIDQRYDQRYGHRPNHRTNPRHGYRHDYRHGWKGDRAHGHREQRARRYAGLAVEQAREARRLGWHPSHPRWSLNYRRHLHWALEREAWRLERETRRRAARLREIRMHYRGYRDGHAFRRW